MSEMIALESVRLAIMLAIWAFLVFVCWEPYREDALRHQLFEIRDELFDYATRGEISFDSPAYGMMRTLLNGQIRHAHRARLLYLLPSMLMILKSKESINFFGAAFESELRPSRLRSEPR